jgi:non-heme chloroperoxidase
MTTMTYPLLTPLPQSTFVERTIDLPTGVRLAYVEQGDPRGLPVVFLHGTSDSWHSFESVLPHLPATIRALVPTQRGHGDSGRPEWDYGPGGFAEDVSAFLDALGIDSAVIVGHSMGSTIALRFALEHPEQTIGLVLMGAFHRWQDLPDIVGLGEFVATLTDPIDPAFVREFQAGTIVQPVPPAFFETAVQESLKLPARVWKAMVRDFIDDDHAARLGSILVPTLLVWGDQDSLIPLDQQDALLNAIPYAQLIVYPGTGHAVHWEQPARAASDVVAFVDSLVSSLLRREAA